MSEQSVVSQSAPYAVEVEAEKAYFWCRCGLSKKEPFCDGAHKGTDFAPMKYIPTEAGTAYFCGCKKTAGQPLCDGRHNA
ncbi:CDGSH iron-sulfur domain-containing protein 3 [Azospirillaceae bacterium]